MDLLSDVPKLSIWGYIRLRVGMKLYKWGIIKGWYYCGIKKKVFFVWSK